MKYSDVTQLVQNNDGGVDCFVEFNDVGLLPFSALPTDTSEHGKKIWSEIQEGKWGEIAPAAESELSLAKSRIWDAIRNERDRRIQTGGYKIGDKWYHSDTFSRTQQMGLVMLGANMPASLMWKTLGGSFVQMTPTLAQQIFAAAAMSDQMIFKAAEVHKAAMESLSNPATYDYLKNWPKAYGE